VEGKGEQTSLEHGAACKAAPTRDLSPNNRVQSRTSCGGGVAARCKENQQNGCFTWSALFVTKRVEGMSQMPNHPVGKVYVGHRLDRQVHQILLCRWK
jgi:hypothetical protein